MSWAALAADLLDPPAPAAQEAIFAALAYEPTPRQWLFHRATEYDVLYGGAAGGGKTKAAVMHAVWAAVAFPGIRVAIFRRTFDELAESVLPELASIDYAERYGARWNKTEAQLRFPNGSLLRCRYLENAQSASRRQGGQYQLVIFEERTLLPTGVAPLVEERLRASKATGIPVLGIRCTSNPGGASHGEVKARYIEPTNYGVHTVTTSTGQTVRFIPAKVTDNPHVDDGYAARLDAIPDSARRAAMRDGSWDSFSGQVFTEWSRDRHVVRPFPLPASWRRYTGIDWGYTNPWAALWLAADEDGRVWVYRELYARQVGETEQAQRILEAEAGDPQPWRVCDPAMFATRGEAEAISSIYERLGVHCEPANHDRLAGWQRIHTFLADGPACLHHRNLGWETCPMLHVFEGVANLIRTLPDLPYSTAKVEDVDTSSEDHACDALRYALLAVGTEPSFHFGQTEEKPEFRPFGPYAMPTSADDPWGG